MKKIYTLMMMFTLMVALSSCGDDYYYSDLLGRWQKVSVIENDYEYDLARGEYEEYVFFDNGTGLYQNEYGTRVDFWWDEYGHDRVHIRFSDGIVEDLYYRFEGSYLIMSDTPSFRNGRVFRYAGGSGRGY